MTIRLNVGCMLLQPVLTVADLPPTTVVHLCAVYRVDFCCFGFAVPAQCLDAWAAPSAERWCELAGQGTHFWGGDTSGENVGLRKPADKRQWHHAHLYPNANMTVQQHIHPPQRLST